MAELETIGQMFDFNGKVALVTGAAMGIGEGIALRLAQAGAAVVISDVAGEAAEKVVQAIRKAGGKAEPFQADVSKVKDIQNVTDHTVERFGRLDILVNNAGIFPFSPALELTPELWQRVIGINLSGAFFQAQAAARKMVEKGIHGRIVNISSVDAFHPTGNLAHYDASKGGLRMLTKSLALEWARYGITVNGVAPGAIQTPGASVTGPDTASADLEATQQAFMARIPLGRMGQPDDIARAVLFLASSAADYITGATLVVDGGYLLS